MPAVQVDGVRVWCATGGTEWKKGNPFLLFVHGAGNHHAVWALQARSLAQHGWNVVAPDLPGHGQSDDLPEIGSIDDYVAWLTRLFKALELDGAAVVGHSMGACIALSFATAHPEETTALVLLGAGEAMPVNDRLLDDTLHQPLDAHRFITAFGHGRAAHFGGAEAPGIWLLGSARALLEQCRPAVLHRDFAACNDWSAAGKIDCEALVISGAADRMTPAKGARALARKLDARFELVPDCGHMIMAESPGRVTRILRSFLDPLRESSRRSLE